MMAGIVKLQFCVTFFVAIIAAIIAALLNQKMGGVLAVGISTVLGGLCCVIPNALFALRLYVNAYADTKNPGGEAGRISPTTFFVGEFLKIVLTVVLFMAVIWLYRDLNWLAFLVGMIVVLKSYLILLFRNQI